MKAKPKIRNQENLFKSRLDQILNNKHPLFVLANQIDWNFFEKEFGDYYCEDNGRPALPIRLMVGTLASAITQAEIMSDGVIDTVFADRGYRGHDYEGSAEVHLAGKKRISRSFKKCLNRRNAIESSLINHVLRHLDSGGIDASVNVSNNLPDLCCFGLDKIGHKKENA